MATLAEVPPEVRVPRLEYYAGEAIEATRLRSPVLRDPYSSRVDARSWTRQKEARTASGIEPREGRVLSQHSDVISVLSVSCLSEGRVKSQKPSERSRED